MKEVPVLEPGKALCPVALPPRDQGRGVRLRALFWSYSQPSYNLAANSSVRSGPLTPKGLQTSELRMRIDAPATWVSFIGSRSPS